MTYKTPKEINEMLAEMRGKDWAKKSDGYWNQISVLYSYNSDLKINKEKSLERSKNLSRKKKEYWTETHKNNQSLRSQQNWKNADFVKKVMAPQMKAVITPFGEFMSTADADRQTNTYFRDKHKIAPHLYYYKDEGPKEETYERVYVTPHGEFRTKQSAYDAAIKNNDVYCKSQKTHDGIFGNTENWWTTVTKKYALSFYTQKMVRREWDLEPTI